MFNLLDTALLSALHILAKFTTLYPVITVLTTGRHFLPYVYANSTGF